MELLHFAQKQKLWSFTLSSASFFVSFDYVFLLRASAIFKTWLLLSLFVPFIFVTSTVLFYLYDKVGSINSLC